MSKKYVHQVKDIPTTPHWAIIESSSVYVPDQGVWAPGHGYPAHDEEFITYVAFTNQEEFLAEMQRMASSPYPKAILGIFVSNFFQPKTVVEVVEQAGGARG